MYWAPSCILYCIGAFYVGLVPIAVFVSAAIQRIAARSGPVEDLSSIPGVDRMRVPFLVTSLVCFFLYSLGKYTPFFALCWHAIPLLQRFISPQKCLLCAVLPLSCLAGIGMDWLARQADRASSEERTGRGVVSLWGAAIVFLLIGVGAAVCLVNDGEPGKAILRRFFNLGSVEPQFAHRIPWNVLLRDAVKLPIVGLISVVLLRLCAIRPGTRRIGAPLLAMVAFADLWVTNAYILEPGPAEILEKPPTHLAKLRPEGRLVRFFEYEHVVLDEVRRLMSNLPAGRSVEGLWPGRSIRSPSEVGPTLARLGREAVYNSWPAADKAFNVYPFCAMASSSVKDVLLRTVHPGVPPPMRERLLAMLNCDRIVMLPDLRQFFATGELGPTRLAILSPPFPRAWVVGGVRVLDTPDAVLEALIDSRFDPTSVALTDRTVSGSNDLAGLRPGRVVHGVTRFEYRPNAVGIEVQTAAPGLLVVSDTYDPGWLATVNGRQEPIYRVNHAFRGVRIPAGTSIVEMTYRPSSVRIGIAVSLVTLAGLIVVLLVRWPAAR
jgi:hypothetical protein